MIGIARLACATLLAVAVGCARAAAGPVESEVDYRLGDGLHLPGTGLNFGGYATGSFKRLDHQPGRLALDDMSLSGWWEGGRWKVFAEFDYENSLSSYAREDDDDDDRYLSLERLYVDYTVAENFTVRGGKFLTPIGRWNLIHATPLVWTTSRPLVTTAAFPVNVTGVMLSGSLPVADRSIDFSLYGSNGDEVRPNPALDTFHEAAGLHVSMPVAGSGQVGFSFVSFEQTRSREVRKALYGIDLFYRRARFEWSAEMVYRSLHDPGSRNDGGGFVQMVAPLMGRLYAVGRFERYRPAQQTRSATILVGGLNFRFTPAVVLKAEWGAADHDDAHLGQQGFLASVSVLF